MAGERAGPRQQLEEGYAEAVNIGADVGLAGAGHLFWGHVVAGADDLAVAGQAALLFDFADKAGQSDVEHLHDGARVRRDGRHQQVRRFDVAVDQLAVVDVLQGERRLIHALASPDRGQTSELLQQHLQAAAGDVLHHEAVGAVDLVSVVGDNQVRVVEGGRRADLAQEAGDRAGAVDDRLGQHLDGDAAVEIGVLRFEDDAHRAAAAELEQLVFAQKELSATQQQLGGLPLGEQVAPNQHVAGLGGVGDALAQVLGLDPFFGREQRTAFEEAEKLALGRDAHRRPVRAFSRAVRPPRLVRRTPIPNPSRNMGIWRPG